MWGVERWKKVDGRLGSGHSIKLEIFIKFFFGPLDKRLSKQCQYLKTYVNKIIHISSNFERNNGRTSGNFFCLNMLVIIGKQMKAPDYLEGRRGSLTVNKYRFFVNITV